VAATLLGGGYSNTNVLIVTGRGRYMLRRYRHGPRDAARRTCAVEAALAARLASTAVPVPEVTAAGEPLLVARHVPGVLVSDAVQSDRAAAPDIAAAAGRALAAIGSVTLERAGFFTGASLAPSAEGQPGSLPEFVDACLRAGRAATALSPAELGQLRDLAAAAGPLAAAAGSARQLVHSDYNGKNLLAVQQDGLWSISAVLDWEFAFSGSPLVDVGNMLRFRAQHPPGFEDGFIAGYQAAGGRLPPRWREISEALDLYALADFLTRPPGHRYFGKAVAVIRERLARGPR
jgi:aminoglycoside phosphotransferase (APT) family kinase protein